MNTQSQHIDRFTDLYSIIRQFVLKTLDFSMWTTVHISHWWRHKGTPSAVVFPFSTESATGWIKMTAHWNNPSWIPSELKGRNVYPLKPRSCGLCRGLASVIGCRCGSRPWKAKAQNSHINWVIPEVHRGICGEILYSWECVHTWDKPPLHGFSILSPASNGTVRLNNLAKAGEWRLRHPYALKGNLATLPHFNKCGGFPLPTGRRCQNKSSLTSCPPKKM